MTKHTSSRSKNGLRIVLGAIIIGIIIVIGILWYMASRAAAPEGPAQAAGQEHHLVADAYPLYSGLTWNSEEQDTMQIGTTSVAGFLVTSSPVSGIVDLSAVTVPFEDYYQAKLMVLGWTEDQMLAADGAGSSMRVFRKGADSIAIMYDSVFHGGGANAPAQCPCDVTASIFSTTAPSATQ